jgi:hypothetical protein
VYNFSDQLPGEIETIFDMFPGMHTGFYRGWGQVGELLGDRYPLLRQSEEIHEMDVPFLVMERDFLTHDPYAKHQSYQLPDQNKKYWDARRSDRGQINKDYQEAAELTFQRFEKRLEGLEAAGKLDDTLVILTSDHGEFLGEYGLLGHSKSMAPEVAFVPTIVYSDGVEIDQEVIGHTDLAAIIGEALGRTADLPPGVADRSDFELPGKDLYVCEMKEPDIVGVWDENGGYVFVDEDVLSRTKWLASKLLISEPRSYFRRHLPELVKHAYWPLVKRPLVYGNPEFDVEDAEELIEKVSRHANTRTKRELTEDTKQQLAELGYVEEAR